MHYRLTVKNDILTIKPNQYIDAPKQFFIDCLNNPNNKLFSIIDNQRIVAIIVTSCFHKDFYRIGIVVSDDIKISELKYIKQVTKELIELYGVKFLCSEGETHKVKDKFHEIMGFEIERNYGTYKRWKFKGLEY